MATIISFFKNILYFIGIKNDHPPHCEDFSLPPGFPPGYCEHRKKERLTKGQVCENPDCPHCRAYKKFISRH